MAGFFITYISLKSEGIRKIRKEIEVMDLFKEEWVPPRINVLTYRKTGKIANLDFVESLYFIETSLNEILTFIAKTLMRKGYIYILSVLPPKFKVVEAKVKEGLTYYESSFISAINSDGSLNLEKIKNLFIQMTDEIYRKSWDCDIDATKKFYRGK